MKKKRDEQGSVVVEASIVVPVFMIAVFFVINIMNILMLHNRVQFAINASAHELASYSYIYSVLGIEDAVKTIENDGQSYTSKIDTASDQVLDCLEAIQNINSIDDLGQARNSGKKTVESVRDLLTDPKGALIGSGYIAAEGGIYAANKVVGETVIKGLTKKYLEQGGHTADEYLIQYGVKNGYGGLDFEGTTMLNDKEHKMIDVVVQYDIDLLSFQAVFDSPKIHVVQRVSVSAWLDGDGEKTEFKKWGR